MDAKLFIPSNTLEPSIDFGAMKKHNRGISLASAVARICLAAASGAYAQISLNMPRFFISSAHLELFLIFLILVVDGTLRRPPPGRLRGEIVLDGSHLISKISH